MKNAPDQPATPTNAVTRIEIIDQTGRIFVQYSLSNVQIHLQDDGRTLKVFCTSEVAAGKE
jgi:hypothetical protein